MIPSIVSLRNLINENREMSSPGGGEAFFGTKQPDRVFLRWKPFFSSGIEVFGEKLGAGHWC